LKAQKAAAKRRFTLRGGGPFLPCDSLARVDFFLVALHGDAVPNRSNAFARIRLKPHLKPQNLIFRGFKIRLSFPIPFIGTIPLLSEQYKGTLRNDRFIFY
jgi:hypothetical protein